MQIAINRKKVGAGNPCYIIAEAGSNHCRNLQYAKELVDTAVRAGADAVKFQIFQAETLYSKFTTNLPYVDGSIFEVMKNHEFDRSWLGELKDYCEQKDIALLASPFDYEAVDLMDRHSIPAYKWASGEIVDLDLLRYAAKKGKPMIISTGMSNLSDIADAENAVKSAGNDKICFLHCTSLYPTPPEHANLRMMDTMMQVYRDYPIGFSDHTLGISIALAAAARGAAIIEKHITLDRDLGSPDHSYSLKPREFAAMVSAIKEIEISMGKSEKAMVQPEQDIAKVARRSLVAAKDIPANTVLSDEFIAVKRPGNGILPKHKPFVLGRKVKNNINKDAILTLADLY